MTAWQEEKVQFTGRMEICTLGFKFLSISDYKTYLKPYFIIINTVSSL